MGVPRRTRVLAAPLCTTLAVTLALAACVRESAPAPPTAAPVVTPAAVPAVIPLSALLRTFTELEGPNVPRSCELVEDDDTWITVWTRAGRSAVELPPVDFDTECVVAVFHGLVRAIEGMDASIETGADTTTLIYNVRGTSGVLSPEVQPWGFYVVAHPTAPIRVECHHRAGPGPAEVTVLATLRTAD